jgi:hypothetical protein
MCIYIWHDISQRWQIWKDADLANLFYQLNTAIAILLEQRQQVPYAKRYVNIFPSMYIHIRKDIWRQFDKACTACIVLNVSTIFSNYHRVIKVRRNLQRQFTAASHSPSVVILLVTGKQQRPILNLTPRGNLSPQGRSCPLGAKFSVRPSLLQNSSVHPWGWTKVLTLPLGEKIPPWGPGVKLRMALRVAWTNRGWGRWRQSRG